MKECNFLHKHRTCPRCGENMVIYGGTRFGKKWTFNRRGCRNGNSKPKIEFFADTFFENSKLKTKKIFKLSYFYLHKLEKKHMS